MSQIANIFLTCFLLVGIFVPTEKQSHETNLNPIKWSLQVDSSRQRIKAGKPFPLHITAQIEPGWHLYSLDEIPNGPRPTRITIAEDQPFTLAGTVEQPSPLTKYDENFGVETQFFITSARFRVPLITQSRMKVGTKKVSVLVRYQTCNDRLCLPPKTVKLETVVVIK